MLSNQVLTKFIPRKAKNRYKYTVEFKWDQKVALLEKDRFYVKKLIRARLSNNLFEIELPKKHVSITVFKK